MRTIYRPPAGFCVVGCARRDSDEGSFLCVMQAHLCVHAAEESVVSYSADEREGGQVCAWQ
jgi:hypothetical protein